MLNAAIEAGRLRAQPVRPLATVMIGALDEAAMSIANADDTTAEKEQVRAVVHDLIDGLMTRAAAKPRARRRR
jgi:Tetracyclin repressor-like, C-terminal domain